MNLKDVEEKSIYIIREAYARFGNCVLLWSIGKDSTALLWLMRKAFLGTIPFPVMHIDTTFKFPEMYRFRDIWAKKWRLDLVIETNANAIRDNINYDTADAFTCCHLLKTVPLQEAIARRKFDAVFVGIRRDEHGIRSKERYFSPRDADFRWEYAKQPPEMWNHFKSHVDAKEHVRVHPLLHWTELDIWQYTKQERIPVNELYFSNSGKRYRSLGCMPITNPIESRARTIRGIIKELRASNEAERAGRAQDKEDTYTMQNLRSLGYM